MLSRVTSIDARHDDHLVSMGRPCPVL